MVTCYGWLLFRAGSLEQIIEFTRILIIDWDLSLTMKRPTFSAILGAPVLIALDVYVYKRDDSYLERVPEAVRGCVYALLLFVLLMGLSNDPTQFIYFQF